MGVLAINCGQQRAQSDAQMFIPVPLRPARPAAVAVGTPVTQRPPHRSRRAVFPHRALQLGTSSSPSGRFASVGPSFLRHWLPM
jgi:hypothetical protein